MAVQEVRNYPDYFAEHGPPLEQGEPDPFELKEQFGHPVMESKKPSTQDRMDNLTFNIGQPKVATAVAVR